MKTMTPEQRVQRLFGGKMKEDEPNDSLFISRKDMTHAIRAAENAALTEVWNYVHDGRDMSGDAKAPLLNFIRSLKSRKPRKTA